MNDIVFRILKLCKRFDYSTCQEILIITKTIALEANILEDAFIFSLVSLWNDTTDYSLLLFCDLQFLLLCILEIIIKCLICSEKN